MPNNNCVPTYPVFRLHALSTDHMESLNPNEARQDYQLDTVTGYVFNSQVTVNNEQTVPIYLLVNSTTGDHMMSRNKEEASPEYHFEGILGYVFTDPMCVDDG